MRRLQSEEAAMAEKPADNRPAMEHGEVKVIKNARIRPADPGKTPAEPGKTPGSAEAGVQEGEPTRDEVGKTPGSAEGGEQ
jgi:hypothetical protein